MPAAKVTKGRFSDAGSEYINVTCFGREAEEVLGIKAAEALSLDQRCVSMGDANRDSEQAAVSRAYVKTWKLSVDVAVYRAESGERTASVTAFGVEAVDASLVKKARVA